MQKISHDLNQNTFSLLCESDSFSCSRLFKQEQNMNSRKDTSPHPDMVTFLCCLTNRTSEPEPSEHAVLCMLMQCSARV